MRVRLVLPELGIHHRNDRILEQNHHDLIDKHKHLLDNLLDLPDQYYQTINRVSDNTGLVNPADYQSDAYVYQLDRDGSTLRSYRFYDVFPTQVSPIELSYDAQGIQEFTVELQVQWWEATKGSGANAGGEDIN